MQSQKLFALYPRLSLAYRLTYLPTKDQPPHLCLISFPRTGVTTATAAEAPAAAAAAAAATTATATLPKELLLVVVGVGLVVLMVVWLL